jgi:hypothetical protein
MTAYRFGAVMDDQTSEMCAAMDGTLFSDEMLTDYEGWLRKHLEDVDSRMNLPRCVLIPIEAEVTG